MTDKIKIIAKVPFYPFPADEEGPRRFQSAGEIEGSVELDKTDNFGTGDIISKERELAGFINNFAKGFHETLMADPSAAKLYMVQKEHTHNSTESKSDGVSGNPAVNNLFKNKVTQNPFIGNNQPSSSPAGEMKNVDVFMHDNDAICPICFNDGYTFTDKNTGQERYVPAGAHKKVSEKDIYYSAKYNKPVTMCYFHSNGCRNETFKVQTYQKWDKVKQEMNDLEGNTDYHTETRTINMAEVPN